MQLNDASVPRHKQFVEDISKKVMFHQIFKTSNACNVKAYDSVSSEMSYAELGAIANTTYVNFAEVLCMNKTW